MKNKDNILDLEFINNETRRLDIAISSLSSISRAKAQTLIRAGKVEVNGEILLKPSSIIFACAKIKTQISIENEDEIEPSKIDYKIEYEDKYFLIINKPAGIVVHPGAGNKKNTLVSGLLYDKVCLSNIGGFDRLGIVHRLDKETSGLMIIAKNNEVHLDFKNMFINREIDKIYWGCVVGQVKDDFGTWESKISRHPKKRTIMTISETGKQAITKFKVLERMKETTLLEYTLITGRTHQIRVQSSQNNHPIVGDKTYNRKSRFKISRHLLHAKSLKFNHPVTSKLIYLDSSLPADFENFLIAQRHITK